jgi:hypothetical protein
VVRKRKETVRESERRVETGAMVELEACRVASKPLARTLSALRADEKRQT